MLLPFPQFATVEILFRCIHQEELTRSQLGRPEIRTSLLLPSVLISRSCCGALSYGKPLLWPWQHLRQETMLFNSLHHCPGLRPDGFWVSPRMENTTSLGNLSQRPVTHTGKKCFVKFLWNLLCSCHWLTENSLIPSSLSPNLFSWLLPFGTLQKPFF